MPTATDRGNYFSRDPFGITYVAALPAVVLCFYPSIYVGLGLVDAWIYTGLIHNYWEILDRIGPTYYAARIAHIMPAAAFDTIFGIDLAPFAFRYFMLLVAGFSAYAFARRLYSPGVGIIAASATVAAPWLLFAYNTDHYDGTATVYLLIAYCLAFVPTQHKFAAQLGAGVFAALAAHVNQLTFGVFATAFPAWLVVHYGVGWRKILGIAAAGTLAFIASYVLLDYLVTLTHPLWARGNPTLQMIAWLLGGEASRWGGSIDAFATLELYYGFGAIIPALLLLVLLAFRQPAGLDQAGRRWAIAAVIVACLPMLLYLQRQLSDHGVMFYYFTLIYLFPSIIFTSIVLIGELSKRLAPQTASRAGWILSAIILLQWALGGSAAYDGIDAALNFWSVIAVVAASTAAFAVLIRHGSVGWQFTFGAAALAFTILLPIQFDWFHIMKDRMENGVRGTDFRKAALHLVDMVHSEVPLEGTRVGFWYKNLPEFNSIQSTYQWMYTRAFPTVAEGVPEMDAGTAELIVQFNPVVVIGRTDAEVQSGVDALGRLYDERSFEYSTTYRGKFDSPTYDYSYAVVNRPGWN